jgi:hypothetical protein
VKIGHSRDVQARIRTLTVGNPDELQVVLILEGSKTQEYEIHGRFKSLRLRGEWFEFAEELRCFVADRLEDDSSLARNEIECADGCCAGNQLQAAARVRRLIVSTMNPDDFQSFCEKTATFAAAVLKGHK